MQVGSNSIETENMNKTIFLSILLIIILSCSTSKKITNYLEEEKTISYVDSVAGFSFKRIKKSQSINLLFLKKFNDSLDIYLNNDKVENFYKNDSHFDSEGNEYVIHDEAPKIETKVVSLKIKSKNYITIALRNSKKKASFEIKENYDNYFISHYNNHWYFTGTKSK
jgi:hypothetical protein